MTHRRLSLAAWLLFCAAHAADYAGTECVGIIDFELDFPAVPEVENQIALGLTALYGTAPWVETSCLVSLRTRACMLGYSATGTISDGHGYCKSSCEAQLAICAGFNDLIGMDPLSQLGLSCEMAVDEPDCHTGGVSQVEEQSPVCPHPLVKPDSASHERDAHVEMIDGTACAMPCPNTLSFDKDDWDAFNIVTLTTTSFALVCSTIAAVTHYLSKNWNIFYLTAGLTISAFTMMLYFAIDYNYSVSCSGNAGHVEHDPFCMVVAAVLIYFCMWFSEWTLLLAANLFLGVVMGWKKPQLEKFRNKALYYIVFMPCLSWAIPMAAGNLGNEWTGANVTTCIYMTTTRTEAYFWAFAWAPLFTYMVIALLLCAFTIYTVTKHTSSMAAYEEGEQGSTAAKKLRKFWRYNKRQIAFLFIFVCTTVVTLAGWMDAHVGSGTRKSEIEDFVECLLTSSTTDPDHARTVCDQPESVDYWKTQLVLCYVGAFGAFPLFVFGTGSFFKRTSEAPTSKDNDSSTVDNRPIRRMTMKLFKAMSVSALKPQAAENAATSIEISSTGEKDKQSTVF